MATLEKILTQANCPSLRANIRMPNLGNKSYFRRCKRILRINQNIHIKNTILIWRTRRTGYCSDEMSPPAFITGKISIVGGQYGWYSGGIIIGVLFANYWDFFFYSACWHDVCALIDIAVVICILLYQLLSYYPSRWIMVYIMVDWWLVEVLNARGAGRPRAAPRNEGWSHTWHLTLKLLSTART